MIKTAQRRFILITSAILFAVFTVIFGVIFGINRNSFSREVHISLSAVEREYTENGEIRFFKAAAVIEISAGGNRNVVCGEDAFTQETINAVLDAVNSRQGDFIGNAENAYFFAKRQGAWRTVYVVDMTEEVARLNSSVLQTLLIIGISFLALCAVVWGLSAKIFEPIKRIFDKQKQFISDASHELKTPVSIIAANTDVIETEENKAYTASIKKQVERLNFLVNDLLHLARLDEGNTKTLKENFNLSHEVTQAVLPFDAVAFEKDKTLNCDIEDNIYYNGAKDAVKQIINILLDNAVKYSAAGGEIKVSLKKQGAKIVLSVYNDGSLIPESDSEKIFERFYRGDASRARDSGGNGLGLSIAKSLAANNNWIIEANSVFGKSMTITLTL